MSAWGSGIAAQLARLAVDSILPPQCLSCREMVATPSGLCGACWGALAFLEGALCVRCGFPFPYDPGSEAACGACIADPPVYRRGRAALAYDDASRPLILAFKHGDRLEGAGLFTTWMARAGAELLAECDRIAPVPLHWTRLFARRYNQAALLALRLGKRSGVAVAPDLLVRTRRTASQGGLGRTARRENMRGAFRIHRRHTATVRNARILLVDDVMTTGATLDACARVLLRAGAASVDVLCLARVLRGEHVA